jgi:hypothetical protein
MRLSDLFILASISDSSICWYSSPNTFS